MKKLIKKNYEDYNIYSYENKYIDICKKIIRKEYSIKSELKNTPRNYVAIVEIDRKKYVYKEPRNEYKLIQRKIMTILKRGEALNTLINVNKMINLGIDSLAKIYCVVNKRKCGMINFSFLLMEYVEENRCKEAGDRNKLNQAINELQKIHKLGYYHGDFNPSNVILTKNEEIKLIDTQLKKDRFFNYKRHYDMITMQYDSYQEMEYPYNKDMIYYLAYLIKRFKKLKRRMRKK